MVANQAFFEVLEGVEKSAEVKREHRRRFHDLFDDVLMAPCPGSDPFDLLHPVPGRWAAEFDNLTMLMTAASSR